MKPGDLVRLADDYFTLPIGPNEVSFGIICCLADREYDWAYDGQGWWVMWCDGDRTMESEKDIVVVS